MRETLWRQALSKIDPSTNAFKILIYLAFSKDQCTPSEIVKKTGIPPGTVRPQLRSLLKKGFVDQDSDGSYKSKITLSEIMSDVYFRLLKVQ